MSSRCRKKTFTEGLNLKGAGVEANDRGQIIVNEHLQTNIPNVYAIGDVVRGAMLAHKAEEEGVYAAEFISGQNPHINHNLIQGLFIPGPKLQRLAKQNRNLLQIILNSNPGHSLQGLWEEHEQVWTLMV